MAGMKFSLREVFFRGAPEGADTAKLMEKYGIEPSPQAVEVEEAPPKDADTLLEKIENRVFNSDETPVTESTDRVPPKRDDLALVRWRKMAGLE